METEHQDAERQWITLVFTGMYEDPKSKPAQRWTAFTADENDGRPYKDLDFKDERLYDKLFDGRPGAVIRIQQKGDGGFTVYPKSAEYLGLWQNADDVARWQTDYDAFRLKERAAKTMKKEVSRSFPKEALKPLRDAYIAASWEKRTLILAEIIRYVTGG